MSTLTYTPDRGSDGQPLGIAIDITPVRFDGDRHQFRWTVREVEAAGGAVLATNDDLWSGSQVGGLPYAGAALEGFKAFCSFFSAWAEARSGDNPESENWNLFPPSLLGLVSVIDSDDVAAWVWDLTGVEPS